MSKLIGRDIVAVRQALDRNGRPVKGFKHVTLDGGTLTIHDDLLEKMRTGKTHRVPGRKQ